jgi:hypothetical protein
LIVVKEVRGLITPPLVGDRVDLKLSEKSKSGSCQFVVSPLRGWVIKPGGSEPQNNPNPKNVKNQCLLFEKQPPSSGRVIKPGGSETKIEKRLQRKYGNRWV